MCFHAILTLLFPSSLTNRQRYLSRPIDEKKKKNGGILGDSVADFQRLFQNIAASEVRGYMVKNVQNNQVYNWYHARF